MSVRRFIFRLLMTKMQDQRRTQFEVLQPQVRPGDIVFLGDSITEGGSWHEWFPTLPVHNRGIAGDTTEGLLQRLHQIGNRPAKLFLLIGTNDITMGVKDQDILTNLEKILATVRSTCPETAVYVQSLLPRKTKRAAHLQRLNTEYARIAKKHGATFIDLWPTFADSDQRLKNEYTNDSLHLLGAGYAAWVPLLQPHVAVADAR